MATVTASSHGLGWDCERDHHHPRRSRLPAERPLFRGARLANGQLLHGRCSMVLGARPDRHSGRRVLSSLRRAAEEGKSMKAVTRRALRAHLMPDRVNPEDPVFNAFPLIRKKGRTRWDSRDHDDALYPESR
jgi:hypothetical protein